MALDKGELKICLAVITINTLMHIYQETVRLREALKNSVCLHLSAKLQLASLLVPLLPGNVPLSPTQILVPLQPELMSALPGACHIRRGNNP